MSGAPGIALKSLCENKSFGSRVDRIERESSPKGGIMIAQHVAEGGVVGEVGSKSESPGDDTGSQTDPKPRKKKFSWTTCRIPLRPFDYLVKPATGPAESI